MKRAAQITLLAFASVIAVGTGLLMLPASTHSGQFGFVDALFTSTSATCVTGLIVVDTGKHFTRFGQGVILLLIQVGGLGIMTLSTGLLVSLGRRASIETKLALAQDMAVMRVNDYRRLVWNVVLLTLAFEAVGAFCLLPVFWHAEGLAAGLWSSVFHTVSAFCNAGFSLYGDSFCRYRGNMWINGVICGLIVSGGIGFVVLWEVRKCFAARRSNRARLSLHSKMVLGATAMLIVLGTLLMWSLERNVTLADMNWLERWLSAGFQSITARTAGFNTVEINHMSNASLFGLIVLMFIGASPCSTGGGIKTTTAAVLVMVAVSRFRGRDSVACGGRTVPPSTVSRSVTLALGAAVLVSVFTAALLITEQANVPHTQSRGKFLELFFEAVSAFGTVGLSLGVTPTLSAVGKVLVTVLMYIGRVGPLALMLVLSRPETADPYRYPDEKVVIG